MFKIISCGGNVELYLDKCLGSVLSQTHTDWEVILTLDKQGDNSFSIGKKYESEKIKLRLNDIPKFALKNICEGIDFSKPNDEDVIVLLDADDWLPSDNTLEIVNSYYQDQRALVTHGSYHFASNGTPGFNCAYVNHEPFRYVIWKGSHLKTLKYKVWKNINQKDFLDEDGNFFIAAWDLAIMFPAMEMAGHDRVKFIHEPTYIYNDTNPLNDSKVRQHLQAKYDGYIRRKSTYPQINF